MRPTKVKSEIEPVTHSGCMQHMKYLLFILSYLGFQQLYAQSLQPGFITDKKTGCRVYNEDPSPNDSISWTGSCKKKMADGYGTLTWYEHGKAVANYTGVMKNGRPNGNGVYHYSNGHTAEGFFVDDHLHGYGIYTMGPGRQLKGHFVHGRILELDSMYLSKLTRQSLSIIDSTDLYIGDGSSKELFYYALTPQQSKGVLVLFPGTWESPEYVLSSNKELVQRAYDNKLAVLVLSLNQRLVLNDQILDFINLAFKDAIAKYQLPKQNFVLGGFSMGGIMSLRYTEMAYEDSSKTTVVPKAVYSVDGPADLEKLYRNFEIKSIGSSPQSEARYGLREFETHVGGSPEKVHERYVYYSTYSRSENNGGNARFLIHVPVRIYTDIDANWWLSNRGVDMYDMNALDQSAMILFLNKQGNKRAEFINAYGKGYRLEGNRHPHSWSIVDPEDCISWILQCIDER